MAENKETNTDRGDEASDNYPGTPGLPIQGYSAFRQRTAPSLQDQMKAQSKFMNGRRRALAASLLQGYEAASHEKWPDVAKSALAAAGIIYPEETE